MGGVGEGKCDVCGWVRTISRCSDLITEKLDLIRNNVVILRACSHRVWTFPGYNVESKSPRKYQINTAVL